ncbi:uncharacterized protein METZ01_LOCUS125685 [marine metagenome]|uniref:Uncharacterized protein n=1 Tax=marine metagenome TaxID=408172 RepID=A0A381Y876_9ZZZZ
MTSYLHIHIDAINRGPTIQGDHKTIT